MLIEVLRTEDFLGAFGSMPAGKIQTRGPHLWVPSRPAKSQSEAEVAFLAAKGAFQLPSPELCTMLLDSYFTYVHPLLPVIEIVPFWKQYELQQPRNISILLLQSMFLAASNVSSVTLEKNFLTKLTYGQQHIPQPVVHANGFASASHMKEAFYERAKVLFDADFEPDKIVRAQSAILLSYWYGNADNIAICWHWIGGRIETSDLVP